MAVEPSPTPAATGITGQCTTLAFYTGAGHQNSGLHAFRTNTLPNELPPQSEVFIYRKMHQSDLSCVSVFTHTPAPTSPGLVMESWSPGPEDRVKCSRKQEAPGTPLGHISTALVCACHTDPGQVRGSWTSLQVVNSTAVWKVVIPTQRVLEIQVFVKLLPAFPSPFPSTWLQKASLSSLNTLV